MYKTEVLTQIDKKLIADWQSLWEKAENANVYNSYEWLLTGLQTKKVTDYELYVLYNNDNLVAILPVQTDSCFGIKVRSSIYKDHLIDTPFLIEKYNKELFKKFFTFIFKSNVYLQKVDEKAVNILHELYPSSLFSLISINPIMLFGDDPFASVSSRTLKQIRKIIRDHPDLRFEMHDKDLDSQMKKIYKFQKLTSKSARSMDIFQDEENKTYYTTVTKNFPHLVRISFLYLKNQLIAYQYGFLWKDYFLGDQIAYHQNYAKLRPGKTIAFFIIEYLKLNNVATLDQGGGISDYKLEFTKEHRLLYNMYFSENMLIMLWWKMINKARRVKQNLFPKKFTRDHEYLFKTI
jgi:hypothetical protein